MPASDLISVSTLAPLIGGPDSPLVIDVREPTGTHRIPAAIRRLPTDRDQRTVIVDQAGAAPLDVVGDGVRWTHQGDLCTFDALLDGLGLAGIAPLALLAPIVRGADTARPELAPEAAGLLALSLGLSRLHADDHRQLEAGMAVYDALYRWARDAREEKHDWTSHQPCGVKA